MWVLLPESKNIQRALQFKLENKSSQPILQEENKLILNIYIIFSIKYLYHFIFIYI